MRTLYYSGNLIICLAIFRLMTTLPSSVADLCNFFMDQDPDADPNPAIFVSDLQDSNKKKILLITFEGTFTSFFKDIKS
jgi:hypothetical protein